MPVGWSLHFRDFSICSFATGKLNQAQLAYLKSFQVVPEPRSALQWLFQLESVGPSVVDLWYGKLFQKLVDLQ